MRRITVKELVLASNNKHKVEEISNILTDYKILTLTVFYSQISFQFYVLSDLQ